MNNWITWKNRICFDVFGHLPLLTNKTYCAYLYGLSKIALSYIDNPVAVELISRIYWYTVEFGLIRDNGLLRIYGSGILSSTGESVYCLKSGIPSQAHRLSGRKDTGYTFISKTSFRNSIL